MTVNARRLPGELHSLAKPAPFRVTFRAHFRGFWSGSGRFWEAKMDTKIDFGSFFCDAFFDRVLALILREFLEARNLENHDFP